MFWIVSIVLIIINIRENLCNTEFVEDNINCTSRDFILYFSLNELYYLNNSFFEIHITRFKFKC